MQHALHLQRTRYGLVGYGSVRRGECEGGEKKACHLTAYVENLFNMSTTKTVDPTISAIASLLGARGGSKRTPKKIASSRRNARKATIARLKKRAAA